MSGFDRLLPSRKVVDEIITTGTGQKTGVTGWTAQGAAARYNSWATPLPPSSSARVLVSTVSSSTGVTVSGSSNFTNPDYPRAVRLAPSTSQAATGNVVVSGTNQFGATVSDTIALGGTGATVDGVVAFKTVTSVVLPASTSGTGTQAAYSLTLGLTNIFGLDRTPLSVASVIAGAKNGTLETTLPVLSSSNATAKFNSAATSSAGALMEVYFHAQDVTHI